MPVKLGLLTLIVVGLALPVPLQRRRLRGPAGGREAGDQARGQGSDRRAP